jgi:hypothetical protein
MGVSEESPTSSGMSQGSSRVELPADVPEDFEVFINGVPQKLGSDYRVQGRTLVFSRSLAQEGRLGPLRWASMFLGVAGTYRRHDTVDVVYERDGKRVVATGLRPEETL